MHKKKTREQLAIKDSAENIHDPFIKEVNVGQHTGQYIYTIYGNKPWALTLLQLPTVVNVP